VIASDDQWTVLINHCTCREDYFRSRLDTCMSLIKATCVCVYVSQVIEFEGKKDNVSIVVISLRTHTVFLDSNERKTPDRVCDHRFCYMLHAE
jgi:hypothetical protein